VFTWDPGSSFLDLGPAVTPEQAQEIERLGYATLWVTGSPAAELSFAEPLLESTTALKVATGIVNIWTADAKTVAASFHRINTAHPGRFVLGIGAGHPEHTEQYRTPYDALVDYLDELDEYRVPASQRVLAALGPRVLRLAAERTAGAHPYNTTPEHTAQARDIIGPNALLAPEHKVLPIADAEEARAVGRKVLNTYNGFHGVQLRWVRWREQDGPRSCGGQRRRVRVAARHFAPDPHREGIRPKSGSGEDERGVA